MLEFGITTPLLSANEELGRESWSAIHVMLGNENFPPDSPQKIASALGRANRAIFAGTVETKLLQGGFQPFIHHLKGKPYTEAKLPRLSQPGLEIDMDSLYAFTAKGGFYAGPKEIRLDLGGRDTLHRFINGSVVRAINEAEKSRKTQIGLPLGEVIPLFGRVA